MREDTSLTSLRKPSLLAPHPITIYCPTGSARLTTSLFPTCPTATPTASNLVVYTSSRCMDCLHGLSSHCFCAAAGMLSIASEPAITCRSPGPFSCGPSQLTLRPAAHSWLDCRCCVCVLAHTHLSEESVRTSRQRPGATARSPSAKMALRPAVPLIARSFGGAKTS